MILKHKEGRLLLFVDWFLPGYKAGGPIKSIAGLVDALRGRIAIDIITRDRDFKSGTAYPNIKTNTWTDFDEGIRVCYLSPGLQVKNIKRLTSTNKYDSVYTNSFFSFQFSIKIRLLYLFHVIAASKYILAPRGELKQAALAVKPGKKDFFLRCARIVGLYKSVTWHATSAAEANDIRQSFGKEVKCFELPNLSPLKHVSAADNVKVPNELRMVFLSRIIEYKNLLFVLELLSATSLLASQKIIFDIYGPIESQEYWDICKQRIESLVSPSLDIHYKGEVDGKDVGQVFSKYHLFVFPTLGENFGHVIAESLLAGTPVLISNNTPWKSLEENRAGWAIPLEQPEKFKSVILDMIQMDQQSFNSFSTSVKHYAAERINNKETTEHYLEEFFV